MTQPSWPTHFARVRARLQSLGARQVKGREFIEQLREIAADYKRALFNDSHAKRPPLEPRRFTALLSRSRIA
jgi:hypothetical protein